MNDASAPAKIILFGEHAVVFDQPAIAVPVSSLRALAVATLAPAGQGLRIIATGLDATLPANVDSTVLDHALTFAARRVLDSLALAPPDLTIRVDSQIPMASGLGSGAAVSAALIRALCAAVDQPMDNDHLNELVYDVEKMHHGTPSGIDNTVIVYESPVVYRRGAAVERLDIGAPFRLIIGDTGRGALTRVAVGDVVHLVETKPTTYRPVIEAIGEIVARARTAIETGDAAALGPLMQQNHAHLQTLTVSSPELDKLVDAATTAGALGAKLSGGGRGGNMIALVTDSTADAVREALLSAGAAHVFETVVGQEGL